jgi:perosamine synthetase
MKIPWWQPQIGHHEYELIKKVFKNNFPNEGPLTNEFEKKLATLLDIKHVITVPSGTSAIFLSLKALCIGSGDEVIVPDLTFIATANAAEMTGAKVVLVDVDPVSLTLDPECFKKAITKKTRAVIPVHVSGRPADMLTICKIAKEHNISVVEDSAEAFMSKLNGKYLGTYGRTGCFSLSPAKSITTGQGGFIAVEDEKLFISLKKLKDQGRAKRGTGGDDIHDTIGYNFKFTDLQAAVGLGQLNYLKKRLKRLQRNYQLYYKYLSDIPEVSLFDCKIKEGEIPLWTDVIVQNRNGLDEFLQKTNADCRRFWIPIHQQKAYKLPDTNFPISTKNAGNVLWLSSAYTLTDENIKTVSNLIRKFYKHAPAK